MLVDIRLIVNDRKKIPEETVSRPLADLQAGAKRIISNIEKIKNCHRKDMSMKPIDRAFLDSVLNKSGTTHALRTEGKKVDFLPGGTELISRFACAVEANILKDPLERKIDAQELEDSYAGSPIKQFRFYISHPWFCGLLALYVKETFYQMSIMYENAWPAIIPTLHLYHALRQQKLVTSNWPSIHEIEEAQGSEHLFAGPKPTNVEEYERRYWFIMGGTATEFASDRRSDKRRGKFKGSRRRQLKQLCPLSKLLFDRYASDSDSDQSTIQTQDIEKILAMCQPTRQQRTTRRKNEPLTAKMLLERFRNTVAVEILELNHDYLGLHVACWNIINNIEDTLQFYKTLNKGKKSLKTRRCAHYITICLFQAMDDIGRLDTVKKAAACFEEYLATAQASYSDNMPSYKHPFVEDAIDDEDLRCQSDRLQATHGRSSVEDLIILEKDPSSPTMSEDGRYRSEFDS